MVLARTHHYATRRLDRWVCLVRVLWSADQLKDRRRIVVAGMGREGNVRAHWVHESKLVTAPFGSLPSPDMAGQR